MNKKHEYQDGEEAIYKHKTLGYAYGFMEIGKMGRGFMPISQWFKTEGEARKYAAHIARAEAEQKKDLSCWDFSKGTD